MKIKILSFVLLCFSSSLWAQDDSNIKIYQQFDSLDQAIFGIQDDKVHVVNFWATWCKPCVKELPYFEEIRKKYPASELDMVLVSMDFEENMEKSLVPFLQKNNIQSTVVLLADLRANKWIDKVSPTWSGSIPATVVYKNDKRLFFEQEFHSAAEIEEIIKQINL